MWSGWIKINKREEIIAIKISENRNKSANLVIEFICKLKYGIKV